METHSQKLRDGHVYVFSEHSLKWPRSVKMINRYSCYQRNTFNMASPKQEISPDGQAADILNNGKGEN